MDCTYRRSLPTDLDTLVDLRVEFLIELHPELTEAQRAEIHTGTAAYLRDRVPQQEYVGYFGTIHDEIVCSSGMLMYTLPPQFSAEGRTIGHILNFFTRKAHRGNGYAAGLMAFIVSDAKVSGITRLFLNATGIGYPLYTRCGFVEPDNKAMQLDL